MTQKHTRHQKLLALLLSLVMVFATIPAFAISASAAPPPSDPLVFDYKDAYLGTYTQNNAATGNKPLVFNVYRTQYCEDPIAGLNQLVFSLTINVPVSYDGVDFIPAEVNASPIMFHNPWGGDAGQPAPGPANKSGLEIAWLMEGWVLVNPGMRGSNSTVGTAGMPDFESFGKLPNPIVDLKAALRYLHHNSALIPGDTERIFAAGTSSGGCGTSMLAVSGNTDLYEDEMEAIGGLLLADGARDDVFGAIPSCPVVIRGDADKAVAWQRFFDFDFDAFEASTAYAAATPSQLEQYEINKGLTLAYNDYIDSLQMEAPSGDPIDTDIMLEVFYPYLEASALKYLNSLASKADVDAYLATYRGLFLRSDFLTPVFTGGDLPVTGLTITSEEDFWSEYFTYLYSLPSITGFNKPKDDVFAVDFQFDKAFSDPAISPDGVIVMGGLSALSNASFGKPGDFAAAYSTFGLEWIQDGGGAGMTTNVDPEYLALYEKQRNSVDPIYFIDSRDALEADIAPYWCLRTGTLDTVTPLVNFFSLATKLAEIEDTEIVDFAVTWDQDHGQTNDVAGAIAFAKDALEDAEGKSIPAAKEASDPFEFVATVAYRGRQTTIITGSTTILGDPNAGDYVYDSYLVTYVSDPIIGKTWAARPSQDYFKMSIKVPVSFTPVGGTKFELNADDVATAPIMYRNPWSGDSGNVPDVIRPAGTMLLNNTMWQGAMQRGWIVVEPGMRGTNCTVGTAGAPGFENSGKLPYPIVDLKASLRYLHWNNGKFPGDADKIIVTGGSSGGSATVQLGSSGNTTLYETHMAETGGLLLADGARDDIWVAAPFYPVMMRGNADPAIAWMLFGDLTDADVPGDASELNKSFSMEFIRYLENDLNLTASFAVPDAGIEAGDALTSENYADYLLVYLRECLVRYLKDVGNRTAIEAYLAGSKNTIQRDSFITPIFDDADELIDVEVTSWTDFWCYNSSITGNAALNGNGASGAAPDPLQKWWYQFDAAGYNNVTLDTDGALPAGTLTSTGIGADNDRANPTELSFGKSSDLGFVFSNFGMSWAEANKGVSFAQSDRDLLELQRNAVDPMYFVLEEEANAGTVDIAPNWVMRAGAADFVIPAPTYVALATKLENLGYNVDAEITWEAGHSQAQVEGDDNQFGMFPFLEATLASTFTVTFDANGGAVAPASAVTRVDGKLAKLPTPTMAGYAFSGWFTAITGGTQVNMDTVYTADTTIFARWSQGGGSGGGPGGGGGNGGGSGGDKPADNPFIDVAENDWFYDYVMYAYKNGLMIGTADDMFSPNNPTTRAMIVTILHRFEGLPKVEGSSKFPDVPDGQWYTDAVIWAAGEAIVLGFPGGDFRPNDYITREQFAAILYRYAKYKECDTSSIIDADLSGYADADQIHDYAIDPMMWVNAEGIIVGRTTTTLVPLGNATRAEAATIMMRFIEGQMK
ncbi:MAG: S-layer homology domain-containing protein [Oscillospiraceae bacterium]|nr:S-layer homology domain-containing protein [Oscillospiraceae bacterium]